MFDNLPALKYPVIHSEDDLVSLSVDVGGLIFASDSLNELDSFDFSSYYNVKVIDVCKNSLGGIVSVDVSSWMSND